MEKILMIIIATAVFVMAGLSVLFISSGAITDTIDFQDDANMQECRTICNQLEEGKTGYTAECAEIYTCENVNENDIIATEGVIPTG